MPGLPPGDATYINREPQVREASTSQDQVDVPGLEVSFLRYSALDSSSAPPVYVSSRAAAFGIPCTSMRHASMGMM
eukprot:1156499-Pelagomonas_calceolata.AAC.10